MRAHRVGGRGLLAVSVFLGLSSLAAGQFFNIPGATLVGQATRAKQAVVNEARIEAALKSVQEDVAEVPALPRFQPRGGSPSLEASRPASRESTGAASRGAASRESGSRESGSRSRFTPGRRVRPVSNSRSSPSPPIPTQVSEEAPSRPVERDEGSRIGSFVPRGNARVFNPSEDSLVAKEPRLQVQDVRESETFLQESTRPLAKDFLPTCPDATFSYIIPSPSQCDLYYLCEYGNPSRKVCKDGEVFSIEEVKCVAAHKEQCEDRPLLQTPKGSGACERRNGIFYTNATCVEFVTCRDNVPAFERCATGLVFDPVQRICAWADEALRPGCMPEDQLGFKCPNPKLTAAQALHSSVHLRFGDHDRFPDSKDCRYFFMCLRTGQPRRAGCSNGKVFDGLSGICKPAKDVPECSDYYGTADPTAVAAPSPALRIASSRIQNIEDDIQKQFAQQRTHQRKQQIQLRLKRWIMEEAEP